MDHGLVKVRMHVWVERSSLEQRFFNVSQALGQIEGARARVAIESQRYEKSQGDQLIQTVLKDFPQKAFKIELGQSTFAVDSNRKTILSAPILIAWAAPYLESLGAALESTAQTDSFETCADWRQTLTRAPCHQLYYIQMVSPDWMGSTLTAGYEDRRKLDLVTKAFVETAPSLLLTLLGTQAQVLYQRCLTWPELDHDQTVRLAGASFVNLRGNVVEIDGKFKLHAQVQVDLSRIDIGAMSHSQVEMVRRQACPS
jgi:hypothetical protein